MAISYRLEDFLFDCIKSAILWARQVRENGGTVINAFG